MAPWPLATSFLGSDTVSLINDMLKDLDARRPDRRHSQGPILEGLGAVSSPGSWAERLPRGGAQLSFALLVLLLGIMAWGSLTPSIQPMLGVGAPGTDPHSDPGALVMAEAIKLLDSPWPAELPDVSQPAPATTSEPGEVRQVALERKADHTRLTLELSRETAHTIERDPSRALLALLLVDTLLIDALPELDFSGTPIRAIHTRQLGEDLSLELELDANVRTQSTMLASGGSAKLVLDFHRARGAKGRAAAKKRAPRRSPSFEKVAHPPSARELAVQTYRHAVKLMQQGDEAGGISALKDALALDAHYPLAREALASTLLHLGRSEEAEALLEDGLSLNPEHAPFAKLQARAMAMRGAIPDALALLESFEVFAAKDPEYHALMAALYQRQGEHAQALTHYQRVLRRQSDKAAWWMGLGISLEGDAKPKEALAAYRAATVLGGLGADSQSYIVERIALLQAEVK